MPESLPHGVVTFLLTDVVESSRLWDTRPADMAQALGRLDAIIRQAVETYQGTLLKPRGEGDSSFSVFTRATAAVQAVRAIALALDAEPWPEQTRLVLRTGLHTGESLEEGGDFFGPTVNRVARIRELALPGQVVLSQATASLVVDHLPDGCLLEPLGERSLRGMRRPEPVYALRIDALIEPPPTTGGARIPLPTAVSTPPMSGFHGRAQELARLVDLLEQACSGGRRFLFLGGEAGVGKSTLAAEVARVAHAAGATVLYGACEEDAGIPYQPWAEALTHLLKHADGRVLSQMGPRRRADLLQLVPHLADHVGLSPTADAIDVEAAQYVLFGAVVEALSHLEQVGPLLLVLDDLHWADPQTLRLEAVFLGAVAHYLGLLAAALGRVDDAVAHFSCAAAIHHRMGAPFHLARTQLEWGRTLLEGGQPADEAEAVGLVEQARLIAERFGCERVRDQASALLVQSRS